jgi:tRNA G18 (ribose-2'-O)-methylase SpoU
VTKTSLGAEKSIPWTWNADSIIAAQLLREEGCQLWALEEDTRSEPISKMTEQNYDTPVVLVVGNEVCGVDPGLLELCEKVFCSNVSVKRSLTRQ